MARWENTRSTWGLPAKIFHWLSALLVLFLTAHGWWMTHMVARAGRMTQYQLHAEIGYYLLFLLALRMLWRAANPVPDMPAELPRWERTTAHAAHWVLYALMLGVSISGWMLAGTFSQPIGETLFGVIDVPQLVEGRAWHRVLEETHEVLSYVLLALVIVHIASALRHHWIRKNDVLRRMMLRD